MTNADLLQQSLATIKKLKQLLKEQKNFSPEPIAIVGMGCRVPGANGIPSFWSLLCEGTNVISKIPKERWGLLDKTNEIAQRDSSAPYWGGYLNHIDYFDAYYFGISPREALRMDPQQRILLEVTYEALEDAGFSVESLAGSNTGVFSALYASQYSKLQQLDVELDALFIPTGNAMSIGANRISYLLDLHGPSMVLDTACSSSLTAVQLACLNLQAQLCDKAIVNAVNINLLPSINTVLSKANMLSRQGQCKTFDATADGYVPGEGAGAIILKPLSRALRDKDKIYAVIKGCAVNQDGKTNGLTAPNGLLQEQLLKDAYKKANIDAATVSYIECHGTGTFLGDPIEAQALGESLGKRAKDKPCWIGSVKTNLGHLEPAAGIVSMIKAALVLKHKTIPPHLNVTTLNPHIQFDKYHLKIPTSIETLPTYGDKAIVGVSGFGFGGANAHIIMEEAPVETAHNILTPEQKELFILSAKDKNALFDMVSLWVDFVKNNQSKNLAALCYHLHVRRSHYPYRLAIVTHSMSHLYQKLAQLEANPTLEDKDILMNQDVKKSIKPVRVTDFESMDLSLLANHYINHALIDFNGYEANRFFEHIEAPLYPWQHKPYWVQLKDSLVSMPKGDHPFQGYGVSSPLEAHQFEFHFNTQNQPYIKDSFHVLHAGFYMEMLAFAMRHLYQSAAFTAKHVEFLSPLVVPDGATVKVQLVLTKEDAFTFYSADNKDNWIKHTQGNVELCENDSQSLDDAKLLAHSDVLKKSSDAFYQRIVDMGMPAGDSLRLIAQYQQEHDALFGVLRQDLGESTLFKLQAHPGLIDACIQTLFLSLPAEINNPYVASRIEQFHWYGSNKRPQYVYSVLHNHPKDGEDIQGDWYLLDNEYQVIGQCNALCLSQLGSSVRISDVIQKQSTFQLDSSLPKEGLKKQLTQYLVEQCAALFSMPTSDFDTKRSLLELGMDSLLALGMIRLLETGLKITYSLPDMMKGPSIDELVVRVLESSNAQLPQQNLPLDTNNLWIANRKIQKNTRFRLFCFPYGGAGASIYREWQSACPDSIEICPIQLPGRENRIEESPIVNMGEMVALLAKHLEPFLDVPFALFGHSFGALIAFELSRYLRQQDLSQPMHFFASAYPSPNEPSNSLDKLLLSLSQKDIHLFDLNEAALGDITETQLAVLSTIFKEHGVVDYGDERMDKNIIKVLLPIFIGDMKLVKNYTYTQQLPLNIPITVFLGKEDTWVLPKENIGWANHTLAGCEFQQLNGGHLFIRDKDMRLKVIKKITDVALSLDIFIR